MRVFAMVLRGILAIPALAIGLMLHFVAVVIHLATGVIERFAAFAASLLAGGTTLLLMIMLVADKGFITKNWLLWVVMYGGAGVLYILPTVIDYVIVGISAVGDWLLRIPPWKGALL